MKYLDLAIANEYLKYYDITKDGKCINKKTNRKYAGGYVWRYE